MRARRQGDSTPMTLAMIATALGVSWFTAQLVDLAFAVLK
jgi:hypothetical protein